MRILLVEDNVSLAEYLSLSLEEEGHVVCLAGNVEEAKDIIASATIDAVVTDLGLPYGPSESHGDGHGLAVANAARNAGLPVVIASGNEALVAMAAAAGWKAHVKDYRMIPDLLSDLEAQREGVARG